MAAVPRRRVHLDPALPGPVHGAGDDVSDRHRDGHAGRPDAHGRLAGRPGPARHRREGHGPDAARVDRPHRLRRGATLGPPTHHRRRAGHHRDRRPGHAGAPGPAAPVGRRRPSRGRVRRERGPRADVRDHVDPVVRRRPGPGRHRRPDRVLPAGRGRVDLRRAHGHPARRRRAPLAADPAAAHPRADRRHRRGADDLPAGGLRRRAQLGLPLLLAARRRAHPPGPARRRLHRRGEALAGLAAPGGRGRPRGPPDHVRRRRLPTAAGTHARPPARVRRVPAGPDRQRCRGAAPDRRPRRGDDRPRPGPGRRRRERRQRVVADEGAAEGPGGLTGRSPTTASGRSAASRAGSPTPGRWRGRRSTVR